MRTATITEGTCARCWDHNSPEYNPDAHNWHRLTCREYGANFDAVAADICPECFDSFMQWFENKPRTAP